MYFTRIRSGIDFRTEEQHAIFAAMEPCLRDGHRVLELGSGTGHYTLALRDRGAKVWARDAAQSMVDYLARRLAEEDGAGIDAGFGRFPDDLRVTGTFDGVLTVGMINYIEDLDGTFRRLAELLEPDGWLVLNVPRDDRAGRRYATVELLGRRRVYVRSPDEVKRSAELAGLTLTYGPVGAGVTAVYRCERPAQ